MKKVKHRQGGVGGEVINQLHCQEAQACSGTSCEWERNSCSPPLSVERGKKRWDFPGTDVQGWGEFSIFSVTDLTLCATAAELYVSEPSFCL